MFKKVLVVVDMQNDFTIGALGNSHTLGVVPKVCDLIRSGDYDLIITTMDTHQGDYLETLEGKNLPVVHCIEGTEGWYLHEKVRKAIEKYKKSGKEYINFYKTTFGCLGLGGFLQSNCGSDTEIDFCGVYSNICVVSNVMIAKASLPESKITVFADACACDSGDEHLKAMDIMKSCQVNIL